MSYVLRVVFVFLKVNIHGEPMFDTVRELLQNYSITRSKHKHLRLNRCVPVKQPGNYLIMNISFAKA